MTHAGHDSPRSLRFLRREDVGVTHTAPLVGSQQCIELPLVVFQGGRPLSASIYRPFPEVVFRGVGQLVEDITYRLPVLQVFRCHDGTTRHQVHRGGYHIKSVAYPDDIGVWHVSPQHRVLYLLFVQGRIVVCLDLQQGWC